MSREQTLPNKNNPHPDLTDPSLDQPDSSLGEYRLQARWDSSHPDLTDLSLDQSDSIQGEYRLQARWDSSRPDLTDPSLDQPDSSLGESGNSLVGFPSESLV